MTSTTRTTKTNVRPYSLLITGLSRTTQRKLRATARASKLTVRATATKILLAALNGE